MADKKPPPRMVKTTFGVGSAQKQQARKERRVQPFRDKLAALQSRDRDEADLAAAIRRGLGLDPEQEDQQ